MHCPDRGTVNPQAACPLSLTEEGARVRVVALRGGVGVDRRMTELGLNVGSELTVRQRQGRGGLVVSRGESRLALGMGLAHKVLVEPAESP
jgi:ferrous iron transport protein A